MYFKLMVRALALAILLGTIVHHAMAQEEDETIVRNFFPPRLVEEALKFETSEVVETNKTFSFVTADFDLMDKEDYLVAIYSTGFSAAVRVIKKQLPAPRLIAESDPSLMLEGPFLKIKVEDLDGDRRPEIIASLSGDQRTMSNWIFKFISPRLVPLGIDKADRRGNIRTLLSNIEFIDVDGDGTKEIISRNFADNTISPPLAEYATYKFQNGDYAPLKKLNFYSLVTVSQGGTIPAEDSFSVPERSENYTLSVMNGDKDGNNRVESASIKLNGNIVVSSQDFIAKGPNFAVPVKLENQNAITFEAAGIVGSRFLITLGPISARSIPLRPKIAPRSDGRRLGNP